MKFFVPYAADQAQAERAYGAFVQMATTYPLAHPTARPCSIRFEHNGRVHSASVGDTISDWPQPIGVVLGIVETTGDARIHTVLRGGRYDLPVLVGRPSILTLAYFDDFPRSP